MDFDFDSVPDRHGQWSLKWNRYGDRDVIPMWVADMDFPTASAVIAALQERVDHGVFGYVDPGPELVDSLIGHLDHTYGWPVDPAWIVWLPGLVSGLNVVCRAIGEPGDEVITAVPIYPPFLSAPGQSGRRAVRVPLQLRDNRWQFDFAALEQAITPRSRLLLLCNPHNPTGRAWRREELAELAAFCRRHDLIVCSDEIHCGLVLDPTLHHVPFATVTPDLADRTITLMAASKTFNLPALGCAFAIVPNAELRRRLHQVMTGIVHRPFGLGLWTTLAAYRDGESWRRALVAYLRSNAALVEDRVASMPGLATTPVEATYLAWIDCRGAALGDPVRFFEPAGVGLYDGADFGLPGFVRLNFACTRALLTEALDRMEKALALRTAP